MSDPTVFPQDVLFKTRDLILNMTLMESFGSGIYSAIFWFTLYMIVFHPRVPGAPVEISKLMTIIPLYILAMIHLTIRWVVCKRVFVADGDTALDVVVGFLTRPEWCIAVSVISFTTMSLIAGFVMVWRLWEIWDHNWKVASVPFLLMLIAVAFAIMSAIFQIDPNSNLESDEVNKFANFAIVYFSLSLAGTVICTSLIAYRVISTTGNAGFNLGTAHTKVLEIVVESAALYSVALIILLPFLAKSNSLDDGYPQTVLIFITGIAPTLVVGRVSFGVLGDDPHLHQDQLSSICFAPGPIVATLRSMNDRNVNTMSSTAGSEGEGGTSEKLRNVRQPVKF